MAKKGNRILIKLVNKQTGTHYISSKNRIENKEKIKVKKFDRKIKKHAMFEEEKIK